MRSHANSHCPTKAAALIQSINVPVLAQDLSVGATAAVGWWVLGHCLVDFFAALGPRFCSLLAFLVQLVLGTEEFDEGLLGSIALLEARAHNAQIAAGAITIAGCHGIE